MAPQPLRRLVPFLFWCLSLFLSLPGPVWLQPSPLPHSAPRAEPHPCHTCRALVDSFNKVGALIASREGLIIGERGALYANLHGLYSQYELLALTVWPSGKVLHSVQFPGQ